MKHHFENDLQAIQGTKEARERANGRKQAKRQNRKRRNAFQRKRNQSQTRPARDGANTLIRCVFDALLLETGPGIKTLVEPPLVFDRQQCLRYGSAHDAEITGIGRNLKTLTEIDQPIEQDRAHFFLIGFLMTVIADRVDHVQLVIGHQLIDQLQCDCL